MNPFKAERDLSFNALESGVLPQIRPCLRPLSSPFYFLIFSPSKKPSLHTLQSIPSCQWHRFKWEWLRWLRWLWSKLHDLSDLSLSEILCVSNLVKPLWRLCSLLRSILMYTQYSDTHVKRFPNATNAEHPARTSFRCSALQQAEWRRCAVQFDASKGRFPRTWVRSRRSQKRRHDEATKPASWVHNICNTYVHILRDLRTGKSSLMKYQVTAGNLSGCRSNRKGSPMKSLGIPHDKASSCFFTCLYNGCPKSSKII